MMVVMVVVMATTAGLYLHTAMLFPAVLPVLFQLQCDMAYALLPKFFPDSGLDHRRLPIGNEMH